MLLLFDIVLLGKASITLILLISILTIPHFLTKLRLGMNKDRFECLMCGNCCRFSIIDLNKEDIKRIEGEGFRDFYEKSRLGNYRLKRHNGKCVFQKDDKCPINEIKPDVCRKFPFYKIFGVIPQCRLWSSCPGASKLKKETKPLSSLLTGT